MRLTSFLSARTAEKGREHEEQSDAPEGDLTETIREVGPATGGGEEESGMTDVELGETDESPEDMQSDVEASDEMTGEIDEADAGEELTEETPAGDEHETDVGATGEDETGIDLGTEADAGDGSESGSDESMAVETDGDQADDDTPPDVAESFEGDEDDKT